MEDFKSLNMSEDIDNIKDIKEEEVEIPSSFEEEGTVGALRQLTTAITEMKAKLSEFVEKFDKYTKAGKF